MMDVPPSERWREYADPARARLLDAARRSLESSGADLSKTVSVDHPSEAERTLIIAMTGSHRPAGTTRLRISLRELDEAIRADTSMTLIALLERLGPPVRNRPGERARLNTARATALDQARTSPLHLTRPWYGQWLHDLETDGTLTSLVRTGDVHLLGQARRVLEILDARLPGAHPIPLPGLSAQATADTKSLSRPGLSGLVLRALAVASGSARPVTTEARRELWDAFDIIVDDLSSQVLVLNLRSGGSGLGRWLREAAEDGTPFVITLHQLISYPITHRPGVVHVCENPAVLRRAATELAERCPPLICTQGWPSTAFQRLARTITGHGVSLRYHSDFDWDGIAMTGKILSQHPSSTWRMTAGDYLAGLRQEGAPVELKGNPSATAWDPALEEAMRSHGCAVYEESVADSLIADLADT
jgi:uncharacterized protein (TIGR02679 family)